MLDYAANAVTYWNLDLFRERYDENAQVQGRDPEADIATLLDEQDADYGEFWERAKTNLRAGRIRLVFVADQIPTELQRVVEFLNERMSPTEVLAVDIRQYVGGGQQMLVPRVLGQTAEARQNKTGRARRSERWDEQSFLEAFERERGGEETEVAREILNRSRRLFSRLDWGTGLSNPSFSPALDHAGHSYFPFRLQVIGGVAILFQYMQLMPPFDREEKKRELSDKLNQISGVEIRADALSGKPRIPVATLAAPERLDALFAVFEWFLSEATAA